ncbi:MAG: tRNA (adenosine(37)-N6)-threonylcarbamoyltransferase complex dimerization subunit type 1 TsaB [Acutalibacteraceae bacterium]|nr:tRNA (adenosine(37)-N6)-threonylcarbamoyltransferase complex dimerization subunit type 1 TsaB [Acutalibacteraceae bacterium]
MKLLSVDCSAKSASCAISQDGKIIASSFINVNLTHSQTLMPMVCDLLKNSKTSIEDIDAYAISAGPGSFTGVRIGISAIKGMAIIKNSPCIAVSTLYAIAQNFRDRDALVCAVMDARCKQVYGALFRVKNGKIKRLCEDRAVKIEEFANEIKKSRVSCPIIIAGDGAAIFYSAVQDKKNVVLSDEAFRYQNGVGVALAGFESYNEGNFTTPEQLLPIYLRLPQAERELNAKQNKQTRIIRTCLKRHSFGTFRFVITRRR